MKNKLEKYIPHHSQSYDQIIGLETIMLFGKHKGLRVREVIIKDKQYIEWLVNNDKTHQYGKTLKTKLKIK